MPTDAPAESVLRRADAWAGQRLEDLVRRWARSGRGWPCQGRVIRPGPVVYLVLVEQECVVQYLETSDLPEQAFFEDVVELNDFLEEVGWEDWFPDGMPYALAQKLRHAGFWWDWQSKVPMRHLGSLCQASRCGRSSWLH